MPPVVEGCVAVLNSVEYVDVEVESVVNIKIYIFNIKIAMTIYKSSRFQ
jgi:hypothetical protein